MPSVWEASNCYSFASLNDYDPSKEKQTIPSPLYSMAFSRVPSLRVEYLFMIIEYLEHEGRIWVDCPMVNSPLLTCFQIKLLSQN